MKKFKSYAMAAALVSAGFGCAGTAQATTIVCSDSPAATCGFDGTSGGWTNLVVPSRTTAAHVFELALPRRGTLSVSITSAYLDLISLSFGGVTMTGLSKGYPYDFDVMGSATPQQLTVVMRNGKNSAFGYSSLIEFQPAVPEPASWALMIAGVALSGAALRRRGRARLALA